MSFKARPVPTVPPVPIVPTVPAVPTASTVPTLCVVPTVPTVSTLPAAPTVPKCYNPTVSSECTDLAYRLYLQDVDNSNSLDLSEFLELATIMNVSLTYEHELTQHKLLIFRVHDKIKSRHARAPHAHGRMQACMHACLRVAYLPRHFGHSMHISR